MKDGELFCEFKPGDNAVDTTPVKTGADSDYVVQLDFRIPSDIILVDTYSIINLGNWPGAERVMLCASEGKSKNQLVLKAQIKGEFVDLPLTYSKGETHTGVIHFKPGKQVDYFVGKGIKLSYLYTGEINTNEITKVRLGNVFGAASGAVYIDNLKVGNAKAAAVDKEGNVPTTWGRLKAIRFSDCKSCALPDFLAD